MMHEPPPKPQLPEARFVALIVSVVDGTSVRVSEQGTRLDGETLDAAETLMEILAIAASARLREQNQ